MAVTWALALLLSFGLRLWGIDHPGAFQIRPGLVVLLLFGPSFVLAIWVLVFGFRKLEPD